MLDAEWDADDGDAECDSQTDMCKGDLDAAKHYPDDVHQDAQAAGVARARGDVMAERPECQSRHLEQLHSERYAYDGHAEQQTYQRVIKANEETSKNNPKYIAYEFHFSLIIQESTLYRPFHP